MHAPSVQVVAPQQTQPGAVEQPRGQGVHPTYLRQHPLDLFPG